MDQEDKETKKDDIGELKKKLKNVCLYGIHGAAGLFMGIALSALTIILSNIGEHFILSNIEEHFGVIGISGIQFRIIEVLPPMTVVFVVYGAYIGYIFNEYKSSSKLAKLGIFSGSIGAIATVFLFDRLLSQGDFGMIMYFAIIFAIAGLVYGIPKIKTMVSAAALGAFGGASGSGIYIIGQNIIIYLNNLWLHENTAVKAFIFLCFSLLAIGVAGASIAIGMYWAEKISYTTRSLPKLLKLSRNTGIILIIFIILILFIFPGIPYARTSTHIVLNNEKSTVYVPVLLDEKGHVTEMYKRLKITGNATTAIIETEHGKALKISGTGLIKINTEESQRRPQHTPDAIDNFLKGFAISMSDDTLSLDSHVIKVWVYSEDDGTEFTFDVLRHSGWGKALSVHAHQELVRGWQTVDFSVKTLILD